MSIAVVYLARGIGASIEVTEGFFKSYRRHPPGYNHNLYVISKGWPNKSDRDKLSQLALTNNAKLINFPDDGFDLGAYFRFANIAEENWLCFLNTNTQIKSDNWLKLLMSALGEKNVGMVGCTGSFGTLRPVFRFIFPIIKETHANHGVLISGAKLLTSYPINFFKYLIIKHYFPSFPNPHIRTNAFVISSDKFRSFSKLRSIPTTKTEAFKLESGYNGLSRFVFSQGLRCLVVNSKGQFHDYKTWPDSQTFRIPGQSGLMICDNQTRAYDLSNYFHKRMMELSAWGKILTNR